MRRFQWIVVLLSITLIPHYGHCASMSDELFEAFNNKDEAKIRKIIDANPNQISDIRENRGDMPLHFAASDFPGLVPYLLEKKADINAKGYIGNTPLHCAARYGPPGSSEDTA